MSSDEELSGTINNEEIDEGDKDTEGSVLSEDSMVSQETAEEIGNVQSSEQTDLPRERPIGVEEQKTIESQERETEQAEQSISETKVPETTIPKEQVGEILEGGKEKQRPKMEDSTRKLFDQFT